MTGVEAFLAQADVVIVMENGSILDAGTIMDLITGPSRAATFLKESIPGPKTITKAQEETEQEEDDDSCKNPFNLEHMNFVWWSLNITRARFMQVHTTPLTKRD